MKAQAHPEEARRLAALRSYGVLDTPSEREFDELVELAAQICETPISLISLVDFDRQWFKATTGTGLKETPRTVSICAHTILGQGPLEIEDLTLDPRTCDNPLVAGDPHLRFYAGMPLETSEGQSLGTLCVVDTKPRHLSDLQRETLRVLGNQVMARLELRRKLRELQDAQAAREREEAFLRLVTDKLPVRLGYLDREYRYRFMNGAYERTFGLAPGTGVGKSVTEIAGETVFLLAKPFLDRALAGDTHVQEFSLPYDFGERRVEVQYTADRNEAGEVQGVVIHVVDATDRYAAQEALREREERYRTLFEAIDEGFCVVEILFDPAGQPFDYRFREINDAFVRFSGISAEAVAKGRTARELFPTLEPLWFDTYAQVATTGESVRLESRVEPMDKWFEVHAFRIGGESSVEVGVLFKDVSERRREETARAEEQARQDRTLENAQVATFDYDVPGNRVYANPLLARIFGIDGADAHGGPIDAYFAAIHPDDRAKTVAAIEASLQTGEPYETQYRVQGEGRQERWVLARGDTTLDEDGKPLRLSGVVLDISERARQEADRDRLLEELEIERAKLVTLFRIAPAFIAVLQGRDLVFDYVNDAYYGIVGYRPIVGLPLATALPEVVAGGPGQDYDQVLLSIMDLGKTVQFAERPVLLQRTPKGPLEERYLDLAYQPLREPDGSVSGVLVHGIDVTEGVLARRRVEESEAKYRTLFTSMGEGYCVAEVVLDEDGCPTDYRFVEVNDAFERLTGIALEDARSGRTIRELSPSVESFSIDLYGRVALSGEAEDYTQHATRLGRWFEGRVVPLGGLRVAVLFNEVTERERLVAELAEEREKFATVLALSPNFVTILRGRELVFEYANPAYERLLGGRPLIGLTLAESQPETVEGGALGQAFDRLLRDVMDRGEPVTFTRQSVFYQPTPDVPLVERILDFVYQPLRDASGTVTGVLAQGADVTDQALAEREIAQREELFRTVFEGAADDAIIVMDAERVVTAWNPAAERICGWCAEEAIGVRADFIFTPEDRAHGRPESEILAAGREGKVDDERWHLRKDGTRFWGSGTMNALHDDRGKVRGYLKVFRDATERYVETRTLAFLRLLTDTLIDQRDPDAIVETTERMLGEYLGASRVLFATVSPDGETTSIRRQWAPDLPALIGTHRLDAFSPTVAAELRAGRTHVSVDALAETKGEGHLDLLLTFGIGSGVSVPILAEGRLSSIVVVHDQGPREWTDDEVGLIRQVADRVTSEVERAHAEAALREANQTLEARVEERTAALRQAVQEAEGFNYSISHDLRTPLRAMVSTASILLEELGPDLEEEHRMLLGRQADNAKRMGRLIDELLRLSRLARVPVNREPLDMTAKARSVAEEVRQSGESNGCRFEVQEGMTATGDRGLVRTVLQNLMGNACKFSPTGGTVWVGQNGGTFSVRDQGVGFDMKYAPKIFLPFERLVLESEFPGTGIGLANVKRIVERHGGRVWVESAPGQGATFFFTLG